MGARVVADHVSGALVVDARFQIPEVRGLVRQRVLNVLEASSNHPIALLVAPAGSGKTTALAQFGTSTQRRHCWYRAEPTDGVGRRVLGQLERALRSSIPGLPGGWTDVESAATSLATIADTERTILFVDDLHRLHGSEGEVALEHLIAYLPPWLSIVAATRHTPGVNLPDLRVSGKLVDIPQDVLRWRPWEVERLFAEFYRDRLRPEEAARLTQRTEGWTAGLQLFHLASQHLPVAGRSELIDGLHTRPGLVRDYLTRNVIDGLPEDLREFLIDTCVLGRLEPRLCDATRDAKDSAAHLADLAERRLFVVPREDGRGFRYHEVLRAYLEISLLERDGPAATRARYQQAARILEAEGATTEAIHANARAEAWDDVARLVGQDGPALASGNAGRGLHELLPPALVSEDPWLRLSQARALLADGRLPEAVEAYRAAELAFGHASAAQICRAELAAVKPWIDSKEHPTRGLTDLLRVATRRDPRRVGTQAAAHDTAGGLLIGSVAMLLAGAVDEADRLARAAGSAPDAEFLTMAAARTVEHVTALARGIEVDTTHILWAAESFEHLGATWLATLARMLSSDRAQAVLNEATALRDVLSRRDDAWGQALVGLIGGIASVVDDQPRPAWLDEAAERFHALGATTLEAWAAAWGALAMAMCGAPEPLSAAEQARTLAHSALVPGAEAVAELAIAAIGGAGSEDARLRADSLAHELGLTGLTRTLSARFQRDTPVAVPPTSSRLVCFGGLRLTLAGNDVDLTGLKPQARAVLALIAMRAGAPVHRDHLIDALWPDEPAAGGTRKLHVLISTLRRHLEPDATAGSWTALVREGETYTLHLPESALVDVRRFGESVADARKAHRTGDREAEIACLQAAFDTYTGELLPEFGAAEWVVGERERYRDHFADVAHALAEWHLAAGDAPASVEAATAGLRADRFRSRLWGLLVDAQRAAGDPAAAARAEAEHVAVLADLGIRQDVTSGS